MPLFGRLKVDVIKKGHRDNGRDQKKNGEFAQDGCVFKRGQEYYFFIFLHSVTLTLILQVEKKNLILLSSALIVYHMERSMAWSMTINHIYLTKYQYLL